MPVPEQTLNQAKAVHAELAAERLPPRVAKLYSQHSRLREGRPGLSAWRLDEQSERLYDAIRLVDAALIEKEAGIASWHMGMKRAAELLEWLSIPALNSEKLPLGLLAAAAYQLAGYPARSSTLLNLEANDGATSGILRSFLQADFVSLMALTNDFWVRNEASAPSDIAQDITSSLQLVVTEKTVAALGVIAAFMRWGESERISLALQALVSIAEVSLGSNDTFSWLLAKLCSVVASRYYDASLRQGLTRLGAEMDSRGRSALERYARMSFMNGRSLCWPSQEQGINRLVEGGNFALCTPTGSGKTAVAELAILRALFSGDDGGNIFRDEPLVLYLVPSRALAAEVEGRLSRVVRRLGEGMPITVTSLYGGADWGPTDAWLTTDRPTVLICTYEKAEALLRFLGSSFLRRLKMVVLDEAHNVNLSEFGTRPGHADSRPLRLEALVARLLALVDRNRTRMIALSAVAARSENAIAHWIGGSDEAMPVRSTYRSTRQLIGRLECSASRFMIRYDLLDGSNLQFEDVQGSGTLFIPEPFPPCPYAAGFGGVEKSLRPYLFWAAMHLASPDSANRARTVLVSIMQQPEGYAKDFLNLLEEQWVGIEKPNFFTYPPSGAKEELWIRCLASCEDYFGTASQEYRLLERGVVLHHGRMPGLMARLLVRLVQEGLIRIVLATSTLSEGVNLPFDTVLVSSLRRGSSDLSVQEFANLAGRAGRPGQAIEGRTLVLLDPNNAEGSGRQASQRYHNLIRQLASRADDAANPPLSPLADLIRDIELHWKEAFKEGSQDDFNHWLETTSVVDVDDLSTTGISGAARELDVLDGVLLAAIIEGGIGAGDNEAGDVEQILKKVWGCTYARYASGEQLRLEELFLRRGSALPKSIFPNAQTRRRLYRTGLPPRAGNVLLQILPEISAHLSAGIGYANWDPSRKFEYIFSLVEIISSIPAFSWTASADSPSDILLWWLNPGLSRRPPPNKITKWQQYVAQNFQYRFGWGLGSVTSVIIDMNESGMAADETEVAWSRTGMPWIAFWIKELMVWGTLDPVAAYLLAAGSVTTRSEAEEQAANYYADFLDGLEPNELLEPSRIKAWVDGQKPVTENSARSSTGPYAVELARDFSGAPHTEWHVLPSNVNGHLVWRDYAGSELARNSYAQQLQDTGSDEYDFVLSSSEKVVRCLRYI